jgi:hypothetical protein
MNKKEKLLAQYFEGPTDDFIQEEEIVCAVPYCEELANESGYCEHHEKLIKERGKGFASPETEQQYFDRLEKKKYHKCATRNCTNHTKETHCSLHQEQIDKYGHEITDQHGNWIVHIYKTYCLVKVWKKAEGKYLEIKCSKEDVDKFKNKRINMRKEDPYIGDTQLKYLIFDSKPDMILWNVDGDRCNVCRDNLEFIDKRTHFALVWGGKPGKSGFRNIKQLGPRTVKKNGRNKYQLTLFYDSKELKIVRKFKTIKHAVCFRDAILNEHYHPRMSEMIRGLYKERKVYG